ncbi:unnamed protein product, partial [Polarella glacialis]
VPAALASPMTPGADLSRTLLASRPWAPQGASLSLSSLPSTSRRILAPGRSSVGERSQGIRSPGSRRALLQDFLPGGAPMVRAGSPAIRADPSTPGSPYNGFLATRPRSTVVPPPTTIVGGQAPWASPVSIAISAPSSRGPSPPRPAPGPLGGGAAASSGAFVSAPPRGGGASAPAAAPCALHSCGSRTVACGAAQPQVSAPKLLRPASSDRFHFEASQPSTSSRYVDVRSLGCRERAAMVSPSVRRPVGLCSASLDSLRNPPSAVIRSFGSSQEQAAAPGHSSLGGCPGGGGLQSVVAAAAAAAASSSPSVSGPLGVPVAAARGFGASCSFSCSSSSQQQQQQQRRSAFFLEVAPPPPLERLSSGPPARSAFGLSERCSESPATAAAAAFAPAGEIP